MALEPHNTPHQTCVDNLASKTTKSHLLIDNLEFYHFCQNARPHIRAPYHVQRIFKTPVPGRVNLSPNKPHYSWSPYLWLTNVSKNLAFYTQLLWSPDKRILITPPSFTAATSSVQYPQLPFQSYNHHFYDISLRQSDNSHSLSQPTAFNQRQRV